MFLDVVVEVPFWEKFCDNVEILFIFEIVQQWKHIGDLTSANLLHDLDLFVGALLLFQHLLDLELIDRFYDDLEAGV